MRLPPLYYRGQTDYPPVAPIGHELVGDLVIAPFKYSDGACSHCRAGYPSSSVAGGVWGAGGND